MARFAWWLAAVGLVGLAAQGLANQEARQQYGQWQFNKDKNYFFREYQFKVNATDKEYQHQYCIYFKNDTKINNKWVYFYNPKTETFWGRYPTVNNDTYKQRVEKRQEAWSELPTVNRQKDIYKIDQTSWPAPKLDYCPTVPGSKDGTLLMAPPPDLP